MNAFDDSREFYGLFWRKINSSEISKLLNEIHIKPIISRDNNSVEYKYPEIGVSLHVEILKTLGVERLTWVTMFSGDGRKYREEYKQYKGILPHGILITDTKKEIQEKLGMPDKWNEIDNEAVAEYESHGLSIHYWNPTPVTYKTMWVADLEVKSPILRKDPSPDDLNFTIAWVLFKREWGGYANAYL
jgi:hypothetical protein